MNPNSELILILIGSSYVVSLFRHSIVIPYQVSAPIITSLDMIMGPLGLAAAITPECHRDPNRHGTTAERHPLPVLFIVLPQGLWGTPGLVPASQV